MPSARQLSRRDFFRSFIPRAPETPVDDAPDAPAEIAGPKVAIIQGRFCLAYQKSFCSTCVERCPVPDAIISERGIPRVIADKCTGCGICHDLCPAPTNAILITKAPANKAAPQPTPAP